MQVIKAGDFTITIGIFHRNKHVYVTHAKTGKQWVSNSPYSDKERSSLQWLSDTIVCGIVKFYPEKIIGSCDGRFWHPVEPVATPRSAFDDLCFIGS